MKINIEHEVCLTILFPVRIVFTSLLNITFYRDRVKSNKEHNNTILLKAAKEEDCKLGKYQ